MHDIVLITHLAMWANVPPLPKKGWTKEQKLAHLERWRPELEVRQKLVQNFRPREGETDVFLYWYSGDRLSYPNCLTEKILTEEEIERLNENDPVLELFEEGWIYSLRVTEEDKLHKYA
ncbi:MAG TPA: hypothetical protein V6C95_23445 [Coleofasciculaceae cyanobacterium]